MSIAGSIALVIALCALTVCAHRISLWHDQEGDYWMTIYKLSLIEPERTKQVYLPVLYWKREHPTSQWRKVLGWEPPTDRMARQLGLETIPGSYE